MEVMHVIQRAYTSRWTVVLVVYDLIGIALIGLHSRTTVVWPFLLWLLLIPLVRYVYLHHMHHAGLVPIPFMWAQAYGIAVGLFLVGLALFGVMGLLVIVMNHLYAMLVWLRLEVGLWGIALSLLFLSTLCILVFVGLLLWGGLTAIVYAEAVMDPKASVRAITRRAWHVVRDQAGFVLRLTLLQAVLGFFAVSMQLMRPSGITWMPWVWPAIVFTPIALTWLLTKSEARVGQATSVPGF